MSNLKRTKQGKFSIEKAINIEDISIDKIIPLEDVIDMPKIEVDNYLYSRIKNGNKLENRYPQDKLAFLYNGKLIGIYTTDKNDNSKIKPKNIFV